MVWSERARQAALSLSSGEEREDDSLTAQLLRDIHVVFSANGDERLRTSDLLERLCEIEESPWGDWYGKTLSGHGLARLLKPYRIRAMPVWVDGQTVKGYKVEQFADAFHRVLGVRRVRKVRSESPSHTAPNPPNPPNRYRATGTPLPGDEFYPLFIAEAGDKRHITEDEFSELYQHHKLVDRAREALAA